MTKFKKIFLSLIVLFALIITTVINTFIQPANADTIETANHTLSNPTTDSDGNTTWDCIYFGNYYQNDINGQTKEPIKWRILKKNGNDVFLLSDKALDTKPWNETANIVTWENCTLRSWLNGYGSNMNKNGIDYTNNNFINTAFTLKEQNAIQTTLVSNKQDPFPDSFAVNDTYDKIYCLAHKEALNSEYGFTNERFVTPTRELTVTPYANAKLDWETCPWGIPGWWLRTMGDDNYRDQSGAVFEWYIGKYASYVMQSGFAYCNGSPVEDSFMTVRPVLHLNIEDTSVYSYAGTVNSNGTMEEIKPPQEKTYDGFARIEAEDYSDQYGVVIDKDTEGNLKNIGGTHNDDWTLYNNVKFTKDAKSIELNYSCQKGSGGYIHVYMDNMNGEPSVVIPIEETGNDWNTYITKTVNLTHIINSGTHKIFLKFVNDGGNVVNVDWFQFSTDTIKNNPITISDAVNIEGFQISSLLEGSRVVGSVEQQINGQSVTGWGFIYALSNIDDKTFPVEDDDMYINSGNEYVKTHVSTPIGTANYRFDTASPTATFFVQTMLFTNKTKQLFNSIYKVRAYATLSDGSYVYSNVINYSIYNIADKLYQDKKMNTLSSHEYLYNNILKIVDTNYTEVDYNWGNIVVKP